ncbi:MAG TPA: DEAD/DEAH box helicase [Bryobacteraceae bacterium]|nr:DEAD/DEAH box helicase [Bryobacteraceae bacterium]
MNQFSELPLSSCLKSALAHHGFEKPTPVQAEAIPPALAGRDLIATAQTGTGKTLAFVLPLLEKLLQQPDGSGVQAVILTPTRELAIQIHETFAKLASGTTIRAAVVVGGLSEQTQLRQIKAGARVLIATPGRLVDYLDRRLVKLAKVNLVVLDEADRMLDMGFLPVIRRILGETPSTRQTLFFSATIETSVAKLIDGYLVNPVRIAIGSTTRVADNVSLRLYEIDQDRKLNLLCDMIGAEKGAYLVFVRTKHGADKLAKNLGRMGVKAARIHGDRTQNQRNEALRGFQQGSYRVLVATDVAARGIHVDGISHVVNYDLPQVPEDFIHRVGRTARAGGSGIASTFATRAQRSDIRKIEKSLSLTLTKTAVAQTVLDSAVIVTPKVVMLPQQQQQRLASANRGPWRKQRYGR